MKYLLFFVAFLAAIFAVVEFPTRSVDAVQPAAVKVTAPSPVTTLAASERAAAREVPETVEPAERGARVVTLAPDRAESVRTELAALFADASEADRVAAMEAVAGWLGDE